MIKIILTALLSAFLLVSSSIAIDGTKCQLAVFQYDTESDTDVLLYQDTSIFIKDLPATGFIGPFSLEVEFKQIDTARVAFNVHVVTLGPPAKTLSRSFTMEYDLPARLREIESKNGSMYSLVITPLTMVQIEGGCDTDYREKGAFGAVPSAYMDLHYVQSSLADYYVETVKGYLDYDFRRFQSFAGFTLPGKMAVYLCPCPLYSVIWDKRFGMSVDPTRNNAFAIYDKNFNSADPFIVTYTSVLRNFGYSPAFISEGLANYFSFSLHDMKQILKEDSAFSLQPMLETYTYFTTNPVTADRTSTSFVKFLINTYNLDHLLKLYKAADDLNLRDKIEEIYEKPFTQLEAEWKNWVDTSGLELRDYSTAAALSETMFSYRQMMKYARELTDRSVSDKDSLRSLRILRQAYFYGGDYYGADSAQSLIVKLDTTDASALMARGSYHMMNGYYDESLADFQKAHSMDSTNQVISFNLALNYLYRGDTTTAGSILEGNISDGKGSMAQGETRIFLGYILKNSGDSSSIRIAERYFQQASNMYQQSLSLQKSSASPYMWLGIALLGLNDAEGAIDFLKVADFLATQPFYNGMINLWLGKAYLQMGQNEAARDHLARVFIYASADYHQQEARKYLEQL